MIRTVFLLIILYVTLHVFPQANPLLFKSITVEDGISHNYVRCIVQDNKGFVWLGTYSGLNRYDGYEIKVYNYNFNDSGSILNNIIRSLCIDSKGRLWIGTQKGLSLYNREKDAFINLNVDYGRSLQPFDILDICEDRFGNLWLGTSEEGLIQYDYIGDEYIQYKHNNQDSASISNNTIRKLFEDSNDNFWIATQGGGLNIFNYNNKNFRHIFHDRNDPQSLIGNSIFAITEDNRGTIWFACFNNGLSSISKDEIDKQIFTNYQYDKDLVNTLCDKSVRALFADKNEGIWIGTEEKGLDFYNLIERKFHHYEHNISDPYSLRNNSVYAIFQDHIGNIWIGTYLGGVNITHLPNNAFKIIQNVEDDNNSLKNNNVWEFQEDKEGFIWIATDGGGLNRYDPKTGKFITYNTNNTNLNTDAILSVFIDSHDDISIGTWNGGFSLFDKNTSSFQTYTSENSKLSDNKVFDITEDHEGNYWLATHNGLIKVNKKTGIIRVYNPENSDLIFHQMEVIKTDIYGNILIGNVLGFIIFDPKTEKFINYTHDPSNEESISDNFITSIFEEDSVTIWISTTNGLNKLNRKTNLITRYNKNDGLPSNLIFGIEKDENGCYWISTNNGLSWFDPLTGYFSNFYKEDGLQNNTFIKKSHLKSKEGFMYFGGINGFNVFHPDEIIIDTNHAELVITELLISSKPVEIGVYNSPLEKDISVTEMIRLTYKQPVFSLKYALLEYRYPERVQYSYMLENFEDDWNNVGSLRIATYTNLDPGEYIFRVKGYRIDNKQMVSSTSIKIVILPPWWNTFIFRLLVIFSIITFSISYYRHRVNQLKKQKQTLEQEVKTRTHELSQTNEKLVEKQKELSDANILLEENQDEILIQNEELEKHRNHLEYLIRERTIELEAAKIKAEESDKLKSAFLANMSHEIRTPMNAIVGFSSLLDSTPLSDDERKTYIEFLNNNCEILTVLINDIIDISLIESNQVQIIKSPFHIDPILIQLLEYSKLKNTKNISISMNNKPDDLQLILDNNHIRFKQIFSNLLSNALKYTDKGFIKFGYEIQNDTVKFYVSDSGIGIPKSDFNRVFNHFQKIEKPDTKIYRGIGIGLSICKRLLELMGGTIWLESEQDRGSTFFFTLPFDKNLVEYPQKSEKKEPRLKLELSNKKILIAEDDPTNYILLKKLLEPTEAEIIWAKNGIEAIEAVEKIIDPENLIILMDIKMPLLNGIEALHNIRKNHKDIPIIAVTAYAHENDKIEILKNNFSGYISKPIEVNQLIGLIKDILEK